ncbi:MAG: hypothetical protein R2911_36775 [Caldilineaceae bacterium]
MSLPRSMIRPFLEQTTYAILWSVLALVLMFWGVRTRTVPERRRPFWR